MCRMPCVVLTLFVLVLARHGQAEPIEVVTETSSYVTSDGARVAGAGTAFVEAVLQAAGISEYNIAIYPWARAYDMALQQPNVLIYLLARTPERENQFKWVGEYTQAEPVLYALQGREDIVVQSIAGARPYRIGVIREDMRHRYLVENGFSRLVVSSQNLENLRKLLSGQVDLVPMPEREARVLCAEAGIDFSQLRAVMSMPDLASDLYLAFSRGTDDALVARAREGFARVRMMAPASKP